MNTTALAEPASLDDASVTLRKLGADARCYAGGVKLLLDIREGRLSPRVIVNLKRIPTLRTVEWSGNRLRIGACVTYREMAVACGQHSGLGPMERMARVVGNVRVRTTGTIGGNLAVADPHADPATALTLMDAEIEVHGPEGSRVVPMAAFHPAPYAPDLRAGEFVAAVHVPPLPASWGWAYERVQRMIQPTLTVATAATLNQGELSDVRLAVGSISPVATRLTGLEAQLRGRELADALDTIATQDDYLHTVTTPESDLWGSAEYKVYIAKALLRRSLTSAARREGES